MVKVSEIIKQVEASVTPFTKEMAEKFKTHLLVVFKTMGAELIREVLMQAYEELMVIEEGEFGASVMGKDPTSLLILRPLFDMQITEELKNNIFFEGDELVINVMDKASLGYPRSDKAPTGPMETVDILVYYLEGLAGEFAFITKDHFKQYKGTPVGPMGRFGKGFMIPKSWYGRGKWEERTGKTFNSVRHPISGQAPYRGFQRALAWLDFSSLIAEALRRTTASMEGSEVSGKKTIG